jgi:hypothetical protein
MLCWRIGSLAENLDMKILVFGTAYCASPGRLRLLELWADALQRIAPDCDHLIVDSQSPVFDLASLPHLSRFAPAIPVPSETAPVVVGRRSTVTFPDNIGHLSHGGRDGWGRAFCQGLLCALTSGHDYVVHVEGDLLTRLDIPQLCRSMREGRINALGAITPNKGWLETGLLFFDVGFLRRSRLIERYAWHKRPPTPYPEVVLSELLGDDLYLRLWRGTKENIAMVQYLIKDLHWITQTTKPAEYEAFMQVGDWPARSYGDPVQQVLV